MTRLQAGSGGGGALLLALALASFRPGTAQVRFPVPTWPTAMCGAALCRVLASSPACARWGPRQGGSTLLFVGHL